LWKAVIPKTSAILSNVPRGKSSAALGYFSSATAGERKLGFGEWVCSILFPFCLQLVSRQHGAAKKKGNSYFQKVFARVARLCANSRVVVGKRGALIREGAGLVDWLRHILALAPVGFGVTAVGRASGR